MENHTLQSFQRWNEVEDYESDETTVTLLDSKGKAISEFNYPGFTRKDFDRFKQEKYQMFPEKDTVACHNCNEEVLRGILNLAKHMGVCTGKQGYTHFKI